MTSKEASDKWNISKRQVNSLCSQGKIPGAKLVKGRWDIPNDYNYKKNLLFTTQTASNKLRKYVNIGNDGFKTIRNSEYIDKSGLISFMNSCLSTPQKLTPLLLISTNMTLFIWI